ncbi:MAG TPA: citryl-CoA lyase [Rhizomicrobium sp.]|jgi:citrate synthase
MNAKSADRMLEEATAWWSTAIIDIHPGEIGVRGYPIQELIGTLTFAQMIWLMLRGELPTAPQARLFEAALVAAVDHGPQAPSIAISRMAVTCGLSVNGAMASAINVLDDVHGGAGQQCMDLLHRIAAESKNGIVDPSVVEDALEGFVFEHGKVIPGYGHRFHPVDPRAIKLLALVRDAQTDGVVSGLYAAIGVLIEKSLARRTGKRLPMNIDGATAVIYSELGFPSLLGRGLFILSRSVGILAHAIEQTEQGGRIKGPMPTSIPYQYTGQSLRHLATALEK